MGAAIRRTIAPARAFGGFYGAIAGIAQLFYADSRYPAAAVGVERDAIAAVVRGGTLSTGGAGFVAGASLFVFIVAQRAISRSTKAGRSPARALADLERNFR
jgi:simple sugar transport system permease protein